MSSDLTDTTVIKACDGNRAENLELIANRMTEMSRKFHSEKDERELAGMAEQLRIIAAEFAPIYAVHWIEQGGTKCGYVGNGVRSNDPTMITCKKCLAMPWFVKLDAEFVRRTGTNWHNLCGDWEPIYDWFDEVEGREGPDVEEVVTRYIEKFDLDDITQGY